MAIYYYYYDESFSIQKEKKYFLWVFRCLSNQPEVATSSLIRSASGSHITKVIKAEYGAGAFKVILPGDASKILKSL